MNGLQFIEMIKAKAEGRSVLLDEVKWNDKVQEYKDKYPHADLTFDRAKGDIVAKAKLDNATKRFHCMKCGELMISRSSQKYDRKTKKWVDKHPRSQKYSNWQCPKCSPPDHGMMPLATFENCIKA